MTLSLAIIINVLADLGLIGGLAYAMSHASRLSPRRGNRHAGRPADPCQAASPRAPLAPCSGHEPGPGPVPPLGGRVVAPAGRAPAGGCLARGRPAAMELDLRRQRPAVRR